jgi:hypothetical protein
MASGGVMKEILINQPRNGSDGGGGIESVERNSGEYHRIYGGGNQKEINNIIRNEMAANNQ